MAERKKQMKKKISVVIPTYNEEGNVKPLAQAIVNVMENELPEYDYEILFIDNHSKDNTRLFLRQLCGDNLQCEKFWTDPFPCLWAETGTGRLCDPNVRRFSGPGRDDSQVCARVGKRVENCDRY